jgi:hypothetical protein
MWIAEICDQSGNWPTADIKTMFQCIPTLPTSMRSTYLRNLITWSFQNEINSKIAQQTRPSVKNWIDLNITL